MGKRAGKKKDDDILFNNLTDQAKAKKLHNQPIQLEVAGLAQHHCIVCDRYFNNEKVHKDHMRGKSHKQKVKSLSKDKPYSHKEAALVAGQGSYVKPEVTADEARAISLNAAYTKTLNDALMQEKWIFSCVQLGFVYYLHTSKRVF